MSDLIMTTGGAPFATEPAAKRKLIELERLGQNVAIVTVEGGFAIKDLAPLPLKEQPQENDAPRRPKRVPLGTRNVLTVREEDKDPNYHYHFISDQSDRIKQAEKAGYEMVCKKVEVGDPKAGKATPVGTPVTKTSGEITQYLMRIRKDWYEEDKVAQQLEITENERAMQQQTKKEGQYGEVKIA